tara:strand:- start:121 stop:1197 length:1077 start_codon:yes stop_codon:yes gene_type:complete
MVNDDFKLPPSKKIKFGLVGSGKVLTSFAKLLVDNKFSPPILVTWKKSLHKRDINLLSNNSNYENIFSFANTHNIELIEADNVNDKKIINKLKSKGVNVIFSISSRWILKDSFINSFNGYVLNIHAGILPRDRGSVVYSKILNGIKQLGVTIHAITSSVDAGPIISQKTFNLRTEDPSINLITSKNIELSLSLLKSFIAKLELNSSFKIKTQNHELGLYMPQPYTEINGYIDWSWKSKHIESFIRAFGRPMPGAMTYYKNQKVIILESFIEKTDIEFHPLYYGRIVNITKNGFAKVITRDALLVITKMKKNGVDMVPQQLLAAPNILYTPHAILEKARIANNKSLDMKSIPIAEFKDK